jgi:hypothetical protein
MEFFFVLWWREFVLASHDSRCAGLPIVAGRYGIQLTASNGPAFETLEIENVAPHKFKRLVTSRRGKDAVYDRAFNIPE